jgi:hypothetical protein
VRSLEAVRAELRSGQDLEPAVLKGGTGKKRHAAILHELRTSGKPVLLFATSVYLGEGVDLPARRNRWRWATRASSSWRSATAAPKPSNSRL